VSRPRKTRYARLMGDFWRHPKVRRLSMEARSVLPMVWSFCADKASDGRVPSELVRMWCGANFDTIIVELEAFLVADDIDYVCRDWLDYNISSEEYEASLEREKARKRPSARAGVSASIPALSLEEEEEEKREERSSTSSPPEAGLTPPAAMAVAAEVRQVFEHWQRVMSSPRSKLDGNRRTAISRGLRDYGLEQCLRAIDGCAASDFHMGRDPKTGGKKYNDLSLIFRNAEKTEGFIARAQPAYTAAVAPTQPGNLEEHREAVLARLRAQREALAAKREEAPCPS
jgi:hypothetical protein